MSALVRDLPKMRHPTSRQSDVHRPFTTILRAGVLSMALLGAATFAADPKVPDTFLPAPGKLHEVLQTPVSGTFRAASPIEVVAALCRQLPANHVYKREPGKAPAPNFTGDFKDTPLRTALYQVAQATHITVELIDRGDGTRLLSFRE